MTTQLKALGFRSEDLDQLLGGVEKPEDSEARAACGFLS